MFGLSHHKGLLLLPHLCLSVSVKLQLCNIWLRHLDLRRLVAGNYLLFPRGTNDTMARQLGGNRPTYRRRLAHVCLLRYRPDYTGALFPKKT